MKQVVCIPVEKVQRAKLLIENILAKKKIMVHSLQKLCGFLNFLCKAVIPGRVFTRRLYAYTSVMDKETTEMRAGLTLWTIFLNSPDIYSRPFMSFIQHDAVEIEFFTDVSANFTHGGFGGYCENSWMAQTWDQFVAQVKPSI